MKLESSQHRSSNATTKRLQSLSREERTRRFDPKLGLRDPLVIQLIRSKPDLPRRSKGIEKYFTLNACFSVHRDVNSILVI